MATVSIVLIGSSTFFRRWVALQLAGSDFVIVAEAANLRAAMARLGAGNNVELSVLQSLDDSARSIAEVRRIRVVLPRAKIVVLATTPTVDLVRSALSIGIDGCLWSAMPSQALIQSLYCIVLGQSLFTADGTTLFLGPPVRGSPSDIGGAAAMPLPRNVMH